jgi:hypothetical protein
MSNVIVDDDENVVETLEETIEALKTVGLVVDSGRREWSEQTGRYEILWMASPRCKGGYEPDQCLCRDLPFDLLTTVCPARLKR